MLWQGCLVSAGNSCESRFIELDTIFQIRQLKCILAWQFLQAAGNQGGVLSKKVWLSMVHSS